MDGFNFFRDIFNKIAGQVDGQDLAGRAVRVAGAGAKAAAERALQEFPHSYIKDAIESAYNTLMSEELADQISMHIRSFDEEKIKDALDAIVLKMQDDDTAAALAKQVAQVLKQADNDQIEGMIEQMIPEDRFSERMIFKAVFNQFRPVLDEMRGMDEEDLAEKIKELAATIPTDVLAMQVGALTREFTPERILEQAQNAVGKLPSGNAVADIMHDVGNAAVRHFDTIANARDLKEAASAFEDFKTDAKAIISGQISADNDAKEKFDNKKGKGKNKGGDGFKF